MKRAAVIALNTFMETIRNKVLYNILLFAVIIIVLSISFGEWSVFARVQVMQDFGLATMSISGLLLAVFIGVGMLGREISSKTVYTLAAKPIGRTAIIIGKYSGLLLTLFINFGLMSLFFLAALLIIGGTIHPELLLAVLLTWIEMALIVSVSLLFSTFTTSTLSAIFTIGFYMIGHFNDFIDIAAIDKTKPVLAIFLRVIYYIIPNLEHFNIRSPVVYGLPISAEHIVLTVIYGILYIWLYLTVSSVIFHRRDL